MIRAVVTDIEGTTTPVSFVTEVLFPYARARLADFLRAEAGRPEVAAEIASLRDMVGDPALTVDSAAATLARWTDEDRKAGPLKAIQGMIWRSAYADGSLRAPVYDDVPPALRRWRESGLALAVYSSGSVEAQKQLFGSSDQGDLTPLFGAYFDTKVGAKREAESYRRIAGQLGLPPEAVLFLSDTPAELAAAREAGLAAVQLDRDAAAPSRSAQGWPIETGFAAIDPAALSPAPGPGAEALAMKPANSTYAALGTSVFEVMSRLAQQHDAINLGQGFPHEAGPDDVREAAARAVLEGWNQYPPMLGLPELRRAVAEHERRFYGLEVDPAAEVMVTSGATEALAACLLALIEPGDEVVLFQPLYDAYLPLVRRAGGVPRLVTLRPPGWTFGRDDLARAFSPRTKAVLFNNPLNPAAKVFGEAELSLLAEFVEAHDAVAICDEVYEHLVFGGRRHVPLISLPGMRRRCLKIGSAGKTFSLTGWKVGYVTAAPELLGAVAKAHQFLTFTTPPNLQAAVAYGLGKDDAYFEGLAAGLEAKRDRLAAGLAGLGFEVLPCDGTYFVNVDVRSVGFNGDDAAFCRHIVEAARVAAIPVGAFYETDRLDTAARFCFAKPDAMLDEAVARLGAIRF